MRNRAEFPDHRLRSGDRSIDVESSGKCPPCRLLREMRLKAGLSQPELARRSGVYYLTISNIETGKGKPKALTWARLMRALSEMMPEKEEIRKEQPSDQPAPEKEETREERIQESRPEFFSIGGYMSREEFFHFLRSKMSQALGAFFNGPLLSTLISNAEFFSRRRYYPGDFATAVEILGELLRAQRRMFSAGLAKDNDDGDEPGQKQQRRPYHRRLG